MQKIKHHLRHENKVNENNVLSYCETLRCETIKKSRFPLCQTYKPTIIFNYISKKWTNIEAGGK